MNTKKTIRNWWRCTTCAAALCCCAMAHAKPVIAKHHHAVETSPWEQAERGRATLEAIPGGTRTRADYTRAMDGFRAIYHESPGDAHAPDSVYSVAELLADQGRSLHDPKSLKAAAGQYEFLRTQYPGSSLRVAALLAEAQIYENDLHDSATSREKYSLLVKQYPRSEQAEEARAGLSSLDKRTDANAQVRRNESELVKPQEVAKSASTAAPEGGTRAMSSDRDTGNSSVSSFAPMPLTHEENTPTTRNTAKRVPIVAEANSAIDRQGAAIPVDAGSEAKTVAAQDAALMHVAKTGTKPRGQMAQVTGIRHWSTPNYTRVAIDLGDDVTYEAARVPNPDRIYFDLHGTRLAQELVGKSFAVTDDGFLKKIRAAQFSNDMTRVVLDVNDVTEYSAFLLPNPYRLIIDIHGGSKDQVAGTKEQGIANPVQENSDAEIPVPRAAAPVKSTMARPVPNTVATSNASAFDVAALSAQPGRVEATSKPTSQPISAVVPGKKDQSSAGVVAATPTDVVATDTAPPSTGKRTKRARASKDVDASAVPARAAVPTADGQTSLVRALGLKIGRIVIDAGHGGHDSGTLGVDGLEEKDVVLDVALRLGKLLHDRLGSEIIYTRSDDTFIPLETRTAIANKAQADLFLSIHANSSSDASARGVETYYLNFTTQIDALEVAARENAVSDQSIHQLSDLVKKIALKDKIAESREFASDVEASLYGGLQRGNAGLKDRGVKKAPFVVLIGANMPSILAEISFVTNPRDAEQLREPEYRERVAESLYKGVAKYAGGLSGPHVATERASSK